MIGLDEPQTLEGLGAGGAVPYHMSVAPTPVH